MQSAQEQPTGAGSPAAGIPQRAARAPEQSQRTLSIARTQTVPRASLIHFSQL